MSYPRHLFSLILFSVIWSAIRDSDLSEIELIRLTSPERREKLRQALVEVLSREDLKDFGEWYGW